MIRYKDVVVQVKLAKLDDVIMGYKGGKLHDCNTCVCTKFCKETTQIVCYDAIIKWLQE